MVSQPLPKVGASAFMNRIIEPASSAAIEPTDRSMPPAMITNVPPTAMMPMNEVRVSTLKMLPMVRKLGLRMVASATTAARPMRGPRPANRKRGRRDRAV